MFFTFLVWITTLCRVMIGFFIDRKNMSISGKASWLTFYMFVGMLSCLQCIWYVIDIITIAAGRWDGFGCPLA